MEPIHRGCCCIGRKQIDKMIWLFFAAVTFVLVFCGSPEVIYAEAGTTLVSGTLYQFDVGATDLIDANTNTTYRIKKAKKENKTTDQGIVTYGQFSLNGELTGLDEVNGYASYTVGEGNVGLTYTYGSNVLSDRNGDWKLTDDITTAANGIQLSFGQRIGKGTIIVQISRDGWKWITDKILTNEFQNHRLQTEPFYTSKDIQVKNGTYYRVLVCYELQKKAKSTWIGPMEIDNIKYKRVAEVYEFYLHDQYNREEEESGESKSLGAKVNTGLDNGYSGNHKLNENDPHYGWDLGRFFVSGYTRDLQGENGRQVFLKNVGDQVTLYFNLIQDIDQLNGDRNLKIADDTNGYDKQFEVKKTDFRRGTLIIQYTDYQNVRHKPIIYTNYLAADASTGANTVVRLFEEGDYQVSLDYEIEDSRQKVLGQSILKGYSDYKISFSFSVRNGNCMVYPFDVTTGDELTNASVTRDGFYLDLAKSRYLDIDITRQVLEDGTDGLVEDTRFNRPARDGEQYTDEGIYVITVSNRYTNQTTTKKIYVGSDEILMAAATTGLSVDEIRQMMADGAEIQDDGTIVSPKVLSSGRSDYEAVSGTS